MDQNLFELASRKKYRFVIAGCGTLTVEDLWDLSLETLDREYKKYCRELKSNEEDTLLDKTELSRELKLVSDKRAIIVLVVQFKKDEAKKRADAKERRQKAARIRELIAKKEDETLTAKSLEELQGLLSDDGEQED